MKKYWLPTVFALFLLLTPAAFAGDGDEQPGFFADLLSQFVALFVGDETGDPELGMYYPPSGNNATGDDPELGMYYPPGGNNVTGGEDPEVGMYYPPGG